MHVQCDFLVERLITGRSRMRISTDYCGGLEERYLENYGLRREKDVKCGENSD